MRQDLLRSQVEGLGGYDSLAEQIGGFFQYVFVGERQYFEAPSWARIDLLTSQIASYESSGLAGLLFIGESSWLGMICLALSLAGLVFVARNASISAEVKTLVLAWIGSSALFTLILTPLPWARYYLPLLPAMILLVAYALTVIASALRMHLSASADDHTVLA